MNESQMLNEDQTAALLGCSVALLRKWRLAGGGPAYCKIGRLVRYRHQDLETYLDAHRVEGGERI